MSKSWKSSLFSEKSYNKKEWREKWMQKNLTVQSKKCEKRGRRKTRKGDGGKREKVRKGDGGKFSLLRKRDGPSKYWGPSLFLKSENFPPSPFLIFLRPLFSFSTVPFFSFSAVPFSRIFYSELTTQLC